MKEIISIIAVALTFISYAPYIRDTIRGKTHPHAYTWFVWSFLTFIIFALQVSDKAGFGAAMTLASGLISLLVFILSLSRGKQYITRIDTVFFVLALLATGLWFFAERPVLSIILLVTIQMLGFIPTVRKSWKKPHSETLSLYEIGVVRHIIGIFALNSYSIVTILFPATWVVANLLFSILLIKRRRVLRRKRR